MSILNTISSARGLKNLIINGDMAIDQRWGGGAISAANSSNLYTLDRWHVYQNGGGGSKMNTGRNQLGFSTPDQHIYYYNVNVISAYTPTTNDGFGVLQNIEGFVAASLLYGTSSAKTATLSFWVRSSLTGTFGGALRNASANRSYPFTYSISVANTWEKKSIVIPGDTTGTWNRTNQRGIAIIFALGSDSAYKGPPGAWAGTNYYDAAGSINLVATNGANWNITGVQFEEGSAATEFERRDFGTELQLCQRYYEKSFELDTAPTTGVIPGRIRFLNFSGTAALDTAHNLTFKTRKRAIPNMTQYISNTGFTATFDNMGTHGGNMFIGSLGTQSVSFNHWTADAEL